MPILSLLYGIIIRMYSELNGKRNVPHIHAEYQGSKAVFGLDGELIEWDFSRKQPKMVEVRVTIHEDDLIANWQLLFQIQVKIKMPKRRQKVY